MKKVTVILTYSFIGFLIYLYGESLLNWIRSGGTDYLLLTTFLAIIFALFPIIPYPIIGGILGAAYGPILGSSVTWIGSSLASIIMFAIVRYGYQDLGQAILHRYSALSKITILFEKNAFMTIFITRLIPVIPSVVVNLYSALSKVAFSSYTVASALGKVPSMVLFAVVGNSIVSNPSELLMIALYYSCFLIIVFTCYKMWIRYGKQPKKLHGS
ncbi:TVP38/TMEM64 family protein [Bacillus solitudinis]|uniref:TVP38/TMEM64 family protein n=1 Tax=Bacillus solitudinis TaxID=2014074 RepID=UPI000C245D36|nr:TVP38/TMEM64 family protein [Bacillus solitudinis]